MPKANAIDLAKTLRKLKTGNFEFFHILTLEHLRWHGNSVLSAWYKCRIILLS